MHKLTQFILKNISQSNILHFIFKSLDYVEPCVGVCHYHREEKWKRENGITDPPVMNFNEIILYFT